MKQGKQDFMIGFVRAHDFYASYHNQGEAFARIALLSNQFSGAIMSLDQYFPYSRESSIVDILKQDVMSQPFNSLL